MYFYKVCVASQRFHGDAPLTYSADDLHAVGSIVDVPLRNTHASGIIVEKATKPAFAAKKINKLLVPTPLPEATLKLLDWLRQYYPAPLGIISSLFIASSLLQKQPNETGKKTPPKTSVLPLPELTSDQKKALQKLAQHPNETALLHGRTGSGKTRVYLEQGRSVLESGKSVLILTPEIGLTSPLVKFFEDNLTHEVIVVHSNLSPRARREAWLRALTTTKPILIIGPRSALFSPLANIGLIIVDEAHDGAYKQDQSPHYQAVRVAAQLRSIHRAQLILGTATPSVSDYYLAKQKNIPIIEMQQMARGTDAHEPKSVLLVDTKDRTCFTKNPYISNTLLDHIAEAMHSGEQSLVFLNRRGTARLVACQQCSWQALCKNCDLPLTFHDDSYVLRCHTCGHTEPVATSCPVCKSVDIIFKSIGTKALVTSLQRLFPEARIRRFDADNLASERFETDYKEISEGAADILVGTQLLVKGHDLPLLSVVGIIAADTSLLFPDYTAEEQTYQMIHQVAGRVGRGHRAGTVVVQTRQPDSATIAAATTDDWDAFYQKQIAERRRYDLPPFVQIVKLSVARATQKSAEQAAITLIDSLRQMKLPVKILGPTPRFIERADKKYRWQIIVKARSRQPLLKIIDELPANWTFDLDPTNLL